MKRRTFVKGAAAVSLAAVTASGCAAISDGLEVRQNDFIYSHTIAPFGNIQVGIAYDKNSNASQTWGEVAIAGLTPYFFETRAAVLVNSDGNAGVRLDAEYEALITQMFILTPSF